MIVHPESCSLLKSLNYPNANIGEVIEVFSGSFTTVQRVKRL